MHVVYIVNPTKGIIMHNTIDAYSTYKFRLVEIGRHIARFHCVDCAQHDQHRVPGEGHEKRTPLFNIIMQ